jgi:hypothetical protein
MFKNPVANLVIGIGVVLWMLFQLFGPHDEAQSQGIIILETILLILAAIGVIGSAILVGKRKPAP